MSDEDDCVIIEDNINYKSITCDSIPEQFLDKLIAKKHFGQFGKIKRFILRPKRLSCTVEYETEIDAEEAICSAGEFSGHEFSVKYTPHEVAHARNTEEWIDPDVQAELDALRPPQHMRSPANKAPLSKIPKASSGLVKTKISSNEVPATTHRVDNSVRSELEAVLRKQAFGTEDRFRILEARDKLIRLTTVRTTDIKKAVSIKGYCPDMCPEKERLMRENRNQVSVFELEEGSRNVMNHKNAIKEYSRSSADQEIPLSHELRPESILKMTMTYLMQNIMDLCESDVNIGDWYHFVWDRTRSIRKDITQQELCSLGTVQLVEQCARFHIHCAARLIAEDPSVFDQKINTENLTKCLQTLKYMYHDLRLKSMKCPNEHEFRTYVILLNLNDANFLWEVKQLPEEIQNSKAIRFALATYLAMESNNYVKFFKLVRDTTYMNACILLRYFTQVRIQALRAIMKAYNWPRHMVSIPLGYLKDILGFESVYAARIFFENYGLECDADKVALDRQAFYIPDVPFVMERAYINVEEKRKSTVGEAICGQQLDLMKVFENHIPHSSFDEDGYLQTDAWNAEDQLKGPSTKKKLASDADSNLFKVPLISPPISPKLKSNSIFGSKQSLETAKLPFFQPITKPPAQPVQATNSTNIFGSFINTESSLFSKPEKPIFSIPALNKPSQNTTKIVTSIFQNSTIDGSSFAANDDIFKHFQTTAPSLEIESIFQKSNQQELERKLQEENAERNRQLQLAKAEEEKRRVLEEEEKRKKQTEIENEKIRLEKEKKVVAQEKRKAQLLEIDKRASVMLTKLIDDEVYTNIAIIAADELKYQVKLSEIIDSIANDLISECVSNLLAEIVKEESTILTKNQTLLQKYFKSWQQNVRRKIEQRKLIESTPVWISDQTINEPHPHQNQTLGMMQRYRLGVPGHIQLKYHAEKPIDVFQLCSKVFHAKTLFSNRCLLRSRKYFKFVISLPHENDEFKGFNSYMNSWLEKNLTRNGNEQSPEFLCESRNDISICLRKVEGVIPANEDGKRVTTECDHLDGMIFVMTCTNFLNARKRLHHLLKLSKVYSKIPVAIIIYNTTTDEDYIENELELQKLVDADKISYYSLFPSTVFINKNNLRKAYEESFKFLARYTKQNCDMEMQNLCSFLRTALGDEFWKRLYDTWRVNPSFRKVCTQPQKVISLYNDAIDILIRVIDVDCDEFPEFPDELRRYVPKQHFDIPVDIEYFPVDWKDESRNQRIRAFLNGLKLQPLKNFPQNLGSLEQALLDYSKSCISDAPLSAERAGYTAIKHLLENINSTDIQDVPLPERFNTISWLTIIQSISLELLTHSWRAHNSSLPSEIIYRKLSFKEYISVPWWFENVSLKSIKMRNTPDTEDGDGLMGPPDCKKPKIQEPSFDVDAVLARSVALIQKADRNIEKYKTISTKSREIGRTLDEKLYRQELFNKTVKKYFESNI